MKKIALLIAVLALAACQHAPQKRTTPDLSSAILTNQGIIDSLTAAQQDDKEIKKAISALQSSNLALHRLHGDMTSNLDRADYKTSVLLK